MSEMQIVVDTNVFYAALRSRRGASHLLLRQIGVNQSFHTHLSVPLVLEYEEVAKRNARTLGLSHADIDDILDYLCSASRLHDIFYLWRPFLPDPDDDMLLELAVEAKGDSIVTFNQRDFRGVQQFGVRAVSPQQLLIETGVLQ